MGTKYTTEIDAERQSQIEAELESIEERNSFRRLVEFRRDDEEEKVLVLSCIAPNGDSVEYGLDETIAKKVLDLIRKTLVVEDESPKTS